MSVLVIKASAACYLWFTGRLSRLPSEMASYVNVLVVLGLIL